jgi:hypothetical protein
MLSKRAEFLVRHNGTTKWDGEALFSQALLFSSRKSPMLLKNSKDKNAGLLPLRDFLCVEKNWLRAIAKRRQSGSFPLPASY